MSPISLSEEDIFQMARRIDSAEARHAYLDQACRDDTSLRQQVEALLAAYNSSESFLESPAAGVAAATDCWPISERPGTIIGPYKLLQQIGEGGMGVVFMAEQTEPIQRTVALKIIKPGMDTRQVIARFEAERQALAMMDHPNIAKVLDAGTTDNGWPYFVMELVKGVPITKYCDEKHLPIHARLELFIEVCQAVQHAHQKGIIHRDIKPNNVLVAEYDNHAVPKIIDFGVAKATAHRLTERTMFTEFGQVLGTMEYMSPEQAKLNQLDIDTRSDIYSLGVVLYELLAGSTPFGGKRLHEAAFDEMLRIIREEEPQKPSTRLSTTDQLPSIAANRGSEPKKLGGVVTGELDWVVMKALEKDRNRRFETASGFAADIQRYLDDEPVQACPPSAVYRFRKFATRNKAALSTAALVCVVLVVGTLISIWQAVRATRARAEAVAQQHRADEQAALAEGVNQFFSEEVFGLADPKRFDRAGIKLVEALDVAASKIDARFPNDPRLRAIIRHRFGEIYQGIDRSQQAVEQLQKAVELRRSIAGDKDLATLQSRSSLGWALFKAGRWIESRDLLEATLADQTQVLGGGHPDTLETAAHLTNVLRELHGYQGTRRAEVDDDRDIQVSQNAYRQALAALGPRHLATLNAESAMAGVMRWRSRDADALPYARESAIGLRETRGRDDLDTMWATYNYAVCLTQLGQPQQAAAELEPLLESRYRILGPSHIDSLITTWRLSASLVQAGQEDKALAVLERNREHLEDIQAARTWQRGQKLLDLAGVYEQLNRFDRAAELVAAACKMADVPPDAQTQRRDYAEWLDRLASKLLQFPPPQRDPRRAVELATRACEASQYNNPNALTLLGRACTEYGDLPAAQKWIAKSLELQRAAVKQTPDDLGLQISLAESLRDTGDLDGALVRFAEVADRTTANVPDLKLRLAAGCSQLAGLLRAKGRLDQAERAYRQAIALREPLVDNATSQIRLAQACDYNDMAFVLKPDSRRPESERDVRKGLALKQALVKEFPDDRDYRMHVVHSYLGLGYVVRDAGRSADGATAFSEATKILDKLGGQDPLTTEPFSTWRGHTLWDLAGAWLSLQRVDDAEQASGSALKVFQDLAAKHPSNPYYRQEQAFTHRQLAAVAQGAGRTADTEDHYRQAIDGYKRLVADAQDSSFYCQELLFTTRSLVDALAHGNPPERETNAAKTQAVWLEAEQVLAQTIARQPDSPGVRKTFADLLQSRGKDAEALATLDELIRRQPSMADAWADRGWLYDKRGEWDKSEVNFAKCIELQPEHPQGWSGRAFSHFHRQQWEPAIADFSKAIELAPDVHTNWFHRGHVYIALAQWDKAAADFTKVVEGWPHDPGGWFFRGCAYAQSNQPQKAISNVRQAIAEGFKDIEHLKSEPKLDPLRSNDEFKKLLIEFEKMKEKK